MSCLKVREIKREGGDEIETGKVKDAKQVAALDLISGLNNHRSYSKSDNQKGKFVYVCCFGNRICFAWVTVLNVYDNYVSVLKAINVFQVPLFGIIYGGKVSLKSRDEDVHKQRDALDTLEFESWRIKRKHRVFASCDVAPGKLSKLLGVRDLLHPRLRLQNCSPIYNVSQEFVTAPEKEPDQVLA
ncbi:vps54-like Vacuolar protein sorting-associated protein 54 [Artemisia annua]|uniref:Vps54-like Vacuolar protein sorting-associated protein 54 n=1 Tax=Artemisia annua TaxID=35608 RepID=A0A2U1MRY7_ARTAN|nr:vps54-like Vacuolar protein sorting-associated protein 54 [Artemisia annua]